ncbi:phosphatidylinositol 4-phosphate 5-kinase 1-like [Iris pallida]|uniref:Phosphatidylinositol 4-phosphate 5-kinase 1-like n=1 Tax=Iris pallida TaxID=29817 RepID=A0AAX6G5K2_IRIPA|nr:phosphatidylinositol 4-phosphate 5-kinase 1-like [Iris pallida]
MGHMERNLIQLAGTARWIIMNHSGEHIQVSPLHCLGDGITGFSQIYRTHHVTNEVSIGHQHPHIVKEVEVSKPSPFCL